MWSQAEFDSVTAKKLCELRERFWPDTVQFSPERMAVVLGDLYSAGATIVSTEQAYGIYFRKEDTLYFVELQADNDRAAAVPRRGQAAGIRDDPLRCGTLRCERKLHASDAGKLI